MRRDPYWDPQPYLRCPESHCSSSHTSPLLPQQMRKDPYWDPQPYFLGSVVAMVQATRMLRAEAPKGLRNIPIFIIQVIDLFYAGGG